MLRVLADAGRSDRPFPPAATRDEPAEDPLAPTRREAHSVYVLKRMIAYAIDSMLIVSPLSFLVLRHTHAVGESLPEGFHVLPGLGLNLLSLGLPILLLGIL